AWKQLIKEANQPIESANLADQDDRDNVRAFAKALVYLRTGNRRYRDEVVAACAAIIGSEDSGNTLALGRELIVYVLAADLVKLPPRDDKKFRAWLRGLRTKRLNNRRTLISTHEDRPNNWGTHAGASRLAVAAYLEDRDEIERCAQVFKGWLGDRSAYAEFKYGDDLSWQVDPRRPVGINPIDSKQNGYVVDGVLPDDQRRGGPFQWPPAKENYVYEALQGAFGQAVILDRAGYDVWDWEDRALLRAFRWLHDEAKFPADGDDGWLPHLVNHYYDAQFPAPVPAQPGKNLGWTDWTHARRTGASPSR
ncbi:MAG: alginate lyase family protein, partial [Planctomycetes bacterium]|nr:alginate lyase family protein [Planctomycetota bacterium]